MGHTYHMLYALYIHTYRVYILVAKWQSSAPFVVSTQSAYHTATTTIVTTTVQQQQYIMTNSKVSTMLT